MSAFFLAFNQIAGQKQRDTMAYQPQANGTAEHMVQTLTRQLKMYVTDVDQKDWDEYAERLSFALHTIRIASEMGSALDIGSIPTVGKYQATQCGTAEMAVSYTDSISACKICSE